MLKDHIIKKGIAMMHIITIFKLSKTVNFKYIIMKAKLRYFILLAFTAFIFQGCEEAIEDILPDEPVENATLTITGAISANINHEEVDFQSSAIQSQSFSGLDLYIGNIGTTETLVRIFMSDSENGELFNTGTYNLVNGPDGPFISFAQYIDTNNNLYVINFDSNDVNQLVLTEVKNSLENAVMKGSIELNLIDSNGTGNKIKITGTFEGTGTAGQL
jgi:hypothetical protein